MTKRTRKRKSIRLKEYDYSLVGAYFITVCTHHREHLFGEIANEQMRVNKYGTIVQDCWDGLTKHYPNVELDQFVVMPNHVHGIVAILDDPLVGAGSPRPNSNITVNTGARKPRPYQYKPTLGQIIGYFKYQSTKHINELRNTPGRPVWQRGYFEHIIRNEKSLNRIREYIHTNPQRWDFDHENLSAEYKDEFDSWIKSFKKSSLP
ncbi:MAG: transposase [Ignavibacteriales bacterium]|nr:transposase [Ignavibacteriales bacterium]